MNKKEKEALANDLTDLQQQLLTARHLLKDAGSKLIPSKEFFDPYKSAFDEKLKGILKDILQQNKIDKDITEKICVDFAKEFNTHILAMTPFNEVKSERKK